MNYLNPEISVLMPFYNAEKYINSAIDSVLSQSFKSFELILINDFSTDSSVNIVEEYARKDKRIKLMNNLKMKGIVGSLKTGIGISIGKYIARMDSDDISLSERFETQYNYLEDKKHVGACFSFIKFIDENGETISEYEHDKITSDYKSILRKLPQNNFLAHPTVMIRSDILKKYSYSYSAQGFEDYELWLRLLNDNIQLEKISKILLLYRTHVMSSTNMLQNDKNWRYMLYKPKFIFFLGCLKSFSLTKFSLRVLMFGFIDYLSYIKISMKKSIKKILWVFIFK